MISSANLYFAERYWDVLVPSIVVLPCILSHLNLVYILCCNILLVVPAKFITEPKRSVTAYKTWDTVLQCNIFGFPSPVVTWTRSGEQLSVNRHFINGSQLTIQNTTEDDDGAYVCQGTNQMANVKRVIWVIVKVIGKFGVKKQTNQVIDDLK